MILEKVVSVLYSGENGSGFNLASFEIRLGFIRDVDELILSFCDLIENFSSDSKLIWQKCHSKKFDCGFQSGDFPKSYQTEIRSDTIERVVKLGASIVITQFIQNLNKSLFFSMCFELKKMKKLFIFNILVLLFINVSCSKPKHLIVGKWQAVNDEKVIFTLTKIIN